MSIVHIETLNFMYIYHKYNFKPTCMTPFQPKVESVSFWTKVRLNRGLRPKALRSLGLAEGLKLKICFAFESFSLNKP